MKTQPSESDYKIVFHKLREAIADQAMRTEGTDIPKLVQCSDEIEVLREIVEDFSEESSLQSATIS